jgi:hypothetical protein
MKIPALNGRQLAQYLLNAGINFVELGSFAARKQVCAQNLRRGIKLYTNKSWFLWQIHRR